MRTDYHSSEGIIFALNSIINANIGATLPTTNIIALINGFNRSTEKKEANVTKWKTRLQKLMKAAVERARRDNNEFKENFSVISAACSAEEKFTDEHRGNKGFISFYSDRDALETIFLDKYR